MITQTYTRTGALHDVQEIVGHWEFTLTLRSALLLTSDRLRGPERGAQHRVSPRC
jgi:hypothetical protein